MIQDYLKDHTNKNFKLIWIESICTLDEVIERNIFKTKVNSPDYKNWDDTEKAAEDFRKRIKEYEKVYETITTEGDGEDQAFIQIINQGTEIVMRNIKGYLESKILSYLVNLHTGDRPIYFTRHGESEDNVKSLIGGDAQLSENGVKYSEHLLNFFKSEISDYSYLEEGPIVYSSTMRRTIQTADKLNSLGQRIVIKNLDELNAGLRDGLSYEQIKHEYPEEYEERLNDKLKYRYPRGESYMDVISRMEPLIYELERNKGPVIVVGHQAALRCLYGYFANIPIETIPNLSIPLNTIIKFVPEAYGFTEQRFSIDTTTGKIEKDDNLLKLDSNLYNIRKQGDGRRESLNP